MNDKLTSKHSTAIASAFGVSGVPAGGLIQTGPVDGTFVRQMREQQRMLNQRASNQLAETFSEQEKIYYKPQEFVLTAQQVAERQAAARQLRCYTVPRHGYSQPITIEQFQDDMGGYVREQQEADSRQRLMGISLQMLEYRQSILLLEEV